LHLNNHNNGKEIIGLKSSDENDMMDAFLLHKNNNLAETLNNGETLRVVYRESYPLHKDKVSINDLDFIKCIGKGGSSDVFLGTLYFY
jgi:hypothetical protein